MIDIDSLLDEYEIDYDGFSYIAVQEIRGTVFGIEATPVATDNWACEVWIRRGSLRNSCKLFPTLGGFETGQSALEAGVKQLYWLGKTLTGVEDDE